MIPGKLRGARQQFGPLWGHLPPLVARHMWHFQQSHVAAHCCVTFPVWLEVLLKAPWAGGTVGVDPLQCTITMGTSGMQEAEASPVRMHWWGSACWGQLE